MFSTTLSFEALSWYTSNLRTSMLLTANKVFGQSALCCLHVNYSSSSVCSSRQLSETYVKVQFVLKFGLEVCSTDLGMLGQIIDYGKMGGNLLRQTLNTEMSTFRDQMEARGRLIFTHIIPDSVNWDWWL